MSAPHRLYRTYIVKNRLDISVGLGDLNDEVLAIVDSPVCACISVAERRKDA